MTMIKDVLILVVGLLTYIQSEPTSLETVWLKDVTTRFQTEKRTLSDLDLPNELTFQLRRETDDLTLNLKRNSAINPNANSYFVRKLKGGEFILVKTRQLEKKDVAYYQDQENGAFMTVRCVKRSNEQCERVISGHIRIGDSSYDLRPAENAVTSRKLLGVLDRLGKRYVLQDQAHIQGGNSVETKDTPYDDEKKGEQELRALVRRFQGKLKQNQSHPSDARLSSRHVAAFHKRGPTDKYRHQKEVYNVKVTVLIDTGIWDLYSSMVHPLARRGLVKRKIREAYSHIMNGVNLRYKEIEDPSISINVFLSEFIFFERETDFQHISSNVTIYNGTKYIEALDYLEDVARWDIANNWNDIPLSDVAMLFSGYTFYTDFPNNTYVRGRSYIDGVCEIAARAIVITAADYFLTVWAAAHELGHSLGAHHDGEGKATACKTEDLFIMTARMATSYPGRPYSRNPWLFSNCSVEAFKETLKDKQCVTTRGIYYNENEYKGYVMKEPGEVYSPNEQCHAIMGPKSILCEGLRTVIIMLYLESRDWVGMHFDEYNNLVTKTIPADICLLMRCTDPKTDICIERYFGAARGTECGQNMWCIEGRCVSKFHNDLNSL